MRHAIGAAIAATAAGLALAPPASAGQYTVDICQEFASGEWRGVPVGLQAQGLASVTNFCQQAGALEAQLPEPAVLAGEEPQFGFVLPVSTPNLAIRRIQTRYVAAGPTSGNPVSVRLVSGGDVLESSTTPNVVDADEFAPAGARDVRWRIACSTGVFDHCTYPSVSGALDLVKARITLEENVAPGAAADGGSLLTAGAQSGVRQLGVDASDGDSGVRRVVARLGGTDVGEALPACTTASWSACPKTAADLAVPVDTTKVADGTHALTLVAEDAAGNASAPVAAGSITVDNVPPPAATRLPSLGGTAKQGATLVLDPGEWNGHGRPVVLEYHWQRSVDGVTWVDVTPAAADATRYVLGSGDLGHRLRATVRASSSEGAREQVAGTTDAIAAASTAGPGAGNPGGSNDGSGSAGNGDTGTTLDGLVPAPGTPNPVSGQPVARMAMSVVDLRRAARVRYGRRVPLTGTLLDPDGRPVVGARVEVFERRSGARDERHVATVISDVHGRFAYTPAAGPSRTVRFGYRARHGDVGFALDQRVSLRVIAGVSLGANRRKLRNGQSVLFRGRVRGTRGRKVVELQVRRGAQWLTFATTHARNGTFRHRYRFRRTWWTARYAFRVRVRKQDGFPYETGSSTTVRVLVRGSGLPRE